MKVLNVGPHICTICGNRTKAKAFFHGNGSAATIWLCTLCDLTPAPIPPPPIPPPVER